MTQRSRESRRAARIQTIQLEPFDDVTSIRDRLQFVEMQRVLLVFPEHGQVLRRKLDLILIQREAARRHLHLALLCHDPDVAAHAASLNMSCFFNTRQARANRWKSPRSKVFIDRTDRPRDSVQHPYELMNVASRLKPALTPRQRRLKWASQALIGVTVAMVIVGVFVALIPSATVVVTPAADAINEPITITADPIITQIDVRGGKVPATVLRLLVQGDAVTVPTTGRRQSEDTLAQGRVELTNQTDSPLFIPAGSVVSTTEIPPARFRTLADVPLPAQSGATAQVEIEALADTPALDGNVPAETITRLEGELETSVGVSNPSPTFGGGLREDSIVTTADHTRLLTLARGAVQQAGRSELLLQLPGEDKFLVPDSIRIVEERPEWTVYSASIDAAVSSVTLEMRAVIEATVVDQLQARQLAFLTLSSRLPEGRELDESSLNYRRSDVGLNAEGLFTFQLFVEGIAPFAINTDGVAERINGMSISQAQRTLERELLLDPRYPPQISVWPVNWGRMPLLPVRIHVEVKRP